MAHNKNTKLLQRIRRIKGQVEAVERTLTEEDECANILMLLAAVRGGINGLMAEVMEDHIRLHLMGEQREATPELAEDLIDIVRAYLK